MREARWRRGTVGATLAAVAVAASGCGGDERPGGPDAVDEVSVAGADETAEEVLIWFLPEAGPQRTLSAEDAAYQLLDDGNPESCEEALDELFGAPPPNGFAAGARSYHAFQAGAHLCLGDRVAAEAALDRALASDWTRPADPVTVERACTVWTQVLLLVDGVGEPCAIAPAVAPSPLPSG